MTGVPAVQANPFDLRSQVAAGTLGRSADRLAVAEDALKRLGNPVRSVAADITDQHAINAAMQRIREELGSIDVNGSGRWPTAP